LARLVDLTAFTDRRGGIFSTLATLSGVPKSIHPHGGTLRIRNMAACPSRTSREKSIADKLS
jgi:hypothetical protein